jgi:hypothetical protein
MNEWRKRKEKTHKRLEKSYTFAQGNKSGNFLFCLEEHEEKEIRTVKVKQLRKLVFPFFMSIKISIKIHRDERSLDASKLFINEYSNGSTH